MTQQIWSHRLITEPNLNQSSMCSNLIHRNGPVTLEEGSRNSRKLSKYINSRDAEPVSLELATVIWHRAEGRSGCKSRCWLHSMHCRCVDRHSSDQQQRHAQPHQAPLKHKAQKTDLKQATTKSSHNRNLWTSRLPWYTCFLQVYVNILQRPYSVSAAFHVWTYAYTISSTYPIFTFETADLKEILWSLCTVDTKLTFPISDTMEVEEQLRRLEDFLVVCLIMADWFGVFC